MNYNTGHIINYVKQGMYGYNTAEWDTLCKYGRQSSYTIWSAADNAWIPDTIMPYLPWVDDLDPYDDCATNVQRGFSDIYYNRDTIFNVPDGVYLFTEQINLPYYIYDPGMYPNQYTIAIQKQGTTVTKYVQLPNCCTYTSAPNSPASVDVQQSTHTLSWTSVPGAQTYKVYRALAVNDHGWHAGNAIQFIAQTTTTSFAFQQMPVFYFYFVSAVNCAGESEKTISPKAK